MPASITLTYASDGAMRTDDDDNFKLVHYRLPSAPPRGGGEGGYSIEWTIQSSALGYLFQPEKGKYLKS